LNLEDPIGRKRIGRPEMLAILKLYLVEQVPIAALN
jgi:hypothetical protein